ncbi:thiamine-phosphate kinase [Microvirga tunisiensis]|uniref:Thiamine-monophosphate kinase n=1 Tax=Pannonibacter tanglangensis TaxID=2750084 RepID=A0A7X5F3M2_9HYPH|nr:thiamine-phosphate kinase [Pannonibacter sp. XCT-53]NBN78175.1 thiamine-phosphate kinase [Pannonibacter sp. XCT-53]
MAGERPHEFALIKRFFAPLASDPGALGLTDDAATLAPSAGCELVLTKDLLAADIHFFSHDPAEAIAAKALRVNLSDLAAKGARPRGYLLGLALPAAWDAEWLERFCAGLAHDQDTYGITLLGGDTIASGGKLLLSVTAIGEVPAGRAVRRTGAAPGDSLYVTGTLGDAALGVRLRYEPDLARSLALSPDDQAHLLDRYLLPQPRTALAAAVLAHASAAMDLSDGLTGDAAHMAAASGVDLAVEVTAVPLSQAARQVLARSPEWLATCLGGGDDYELLLAVPEDRRDAFERDAAAAGVPVTRIGAARPPVGATGVLGYFRDGASFTLAGKGGFRHF